MDNKASFFRDKGVGYYLALPVAALAVLAAYFYKKNGITQFSPNLNTLAIYTAWAAAALSLVSVVINGKLIKYAAYLAALFSCIQFLSSQATYIVNIMVSIDGTSFSSGFLSTAICYAAAIILGLFAAITAHWKPWAKEE